MVNRREKPRKYQWSDIQYIERVRAANFGPYLGRIWLFTGAKSRYDLVSLGDALKLADSHSPAPLTIRDGTGEVGAQSIAPGKSVQWAFEAAERWLAAQPAVLVAQMPLTQLRFRHGSVFARPWVEKGRKYGTLHFAPQKDGVLIRAVMGCELSDLPLVNQAGATPRMIVAWRNWVGGLWESMGSEADRTPPPVSRSEAERMVTQGRNALVGGGFGFLLAIGVMGLVAYLARSLAPATLQILVNGVGFGLAFPSGLAAFYGGLRYRSGKALLRMTPLQAPPSSVPLSYRALAAADMEPALVYFRGMGFYSEHADKSDLALARQILADAQDELIVPERAPNFLIDLEALRGDQERVWWEDTEADVAKGGEVYVETLEAWSRVSRGAFTPSEIRETWEAEDGPITLRFKLAGEDREIHPQYLDDFIDLNILQAVNAMIAPRGVRFAVVDTGSQDFFVVAITEEERARLAAERGWPFLELTSP